MKVLFLLKMFFAIILLLAISLVSLMTFIIFNNPSAEDHKAASILHAAVLRKYEFGCQVSFTPHPSKVILRINGNFTEDQKLSISTEIHDLAEDLLIITPP